MKDKDSAAAMTIDEIDEVIADLEKERDDRIFEDRYHHER